jgi:hypothetical protein
VNRLLLWGIAGLALVLSLGMNLRQAQIIGEKKQELRTASAALVASAKALKQAGENLKEYQDGNVLNRDEAARLCRADALAAYDAGSLRGQRSLSERQSSGAFVPGQRAAGGNR